MLNRIYISSDIEGTCGIAHWDETELGRSEHDYFRRQKDGDRAQRRRAVFLRHLL